MPRSKSDAIRKKEGTRLWNLREKYGLTVRDAAREFNVAPSAISHWENGERTMPGPALRLLGLFEAGRIKPGEKI